MSITQLIKRTPIARTLLAGPLAVRRTILRRQRQHASDIMARFENLVTKDVQIRVDEFDGEFVIGPRSHLLHRLLVNGIYEPDLVQLFLSHIQKDRDVIDVGANVGFFTVLAAKQLGMGRVLAAEPTSAAYARLAANIQLNNVIKNVILFNGLVSDRDGQDTVNIVPGREEYSSMGDVVHPSVAGQATQQEKIETCTLDTLVKDNNLNPALLKVDVEGAEALVFGGAERTLKTHKPVVISEFSPMLLEQNGSSGEAVIAMFKRCNYSVHDPHDPKAKLEHSVSGDMIALPN